MSAQLVQLLEHRPGSMQQIGREHAHWRAESATLRWLNRDERLFGSSVGGIGLGRKADSLAKGPRLKEELLEEV